MKKRLKQLLHRTENTCRGTKWHYLFGYANTNYNEIVLLTKIKKSDDTEYWRGYVLTYTWLKSV